MKTMFSVTLRNDSDGQEHVRQVLSADVEKATQAAIRKSKAALPTMAERTYATFSVSCAPTAKQEG